MVVRLPVDGVAGPASSPSAASSNGWSVAGAVGSAGAGVTAAAISDRAPSLGATPVSTGGGASEAGADRTGPLATVVFRGFRTVAAGVAGHESEEEREPERQEQPRERADRLAGGQRDLVVRGRLTHEGAV